MSKRGRSNSGAGNGGAGGGGRGGTTSLEMWNALPWRSVDVTEENLGDFEDSVFFGLEEIDGNAYKLQKTASSYSVSPAIDDGTADSSSNKKTKRKSLKEIRKEALANKDGESGKNGGSSEAKTEVQSKKAKNEKNEKKEKKQKDKPKGKSPAVAAAVPPAAVVPEGLADWGGIKLHVLLQQALISLNFHSPTPIQLAAIPVTTTGKHDLVGAAETGSGKTLAFALPVVDFLLRNWEAYANRLSPVAMIIAPTRELAMQITSVMKEVCAPFRSMRKIEVVSVVGGMSEQKQRRQLCGGVNPSNSSGGYRKPVHVLVATPGRLCELIQDDTIPMFADMSGIRFLIVDEADRIVEEGHFPEVSYDAYVCRSSCVAFWEIPRSL